MPKYNLLTDPPFSQMSPKGLPFTRLGKPVPKLNIMAASAVIDNFAPNVTKLINFTKKNK